MKPLNFFKKNDEGQDLQIESRYASGVTLLKNDHIEEALIQFEKVLSLKSDHTLAHYRIGEIRHREGEFEQALIHFKQALKTNNGEIEPVNIHIALATTFFPLGQLEQAIQEFKKAIELNPKRRDLYLDIGELYYQRGENDEAIYHFQQTDQRDSTAQIYLAKAYWTKGDHQKSLNILRYASKNFPADPEIHAYLGYLLLEKKVYEEAIKILHKALELNKKPDEKIFANLGDAYYESGDFEEALKIYNQAANIFPYNPFFHKRIGFIYKEQNNLDRAIQVWRHMVEIDNSDPDALTTLAFGLRLNGDFEAALQEIRQAITLDPTYAPAYASEGNIFLDMGRTEAAITSFEQAINSGDNWALLDLAEVYQDLDNVNRATHYAKAFIAAAREDSELENGIEDAKSILDALQQFDESGSS